MMAVYEQVCAIRGLATSVISVFVSSENIKLEEKIDRKFNFPTAVLPGNNHTQ